MVTAGPAGSRSSRRSCAWTRSRSCCPRASRPRPTPRTTRQASRGRTHRRRRPSPASSPKSAPLSWATSICRSRTDAKRSRRAIGEGISGGVARTGQPTLLVGPVPGSSDPAVSESMIVPLRVAERTIGIVNVKHHAPQSRYGQTQLDALVLFAQDLAIAYTTAGELQHAIDDRQQAIVLYELSRFATLGTDPENDLGAAVAMLAGTLRHDAVAVWQHANDRLRLRAATGYEAQTGAEIVLDEADTTLATVLREKHTARTHIGMSEDRPEWAAPGCTQFLLAPIAAFGVLVFARATTEYSDAERDFRATIAGYVVGMLQKASAQDVG